MKNDEKLKSLCWQYIEIISRMSQGQADIRQGERIRRELHHQILELTGLSAFEFGGLPLWVEIEDIDQMAARLYQVLVGACAARAVHAAAQEES